MICTKCNACSQRKEYNPAPYSEPGLLWPWNIKRNRHSGAFFEDDATMKDELLPAILPATDPYYHNQLNRPASIANQIEMMKYRDGTTAVMYNNHLAVAENVPTGLRTQPRPIKNTNNQGQQHQPQQRSTFDFEPVVLFNLPDKMTTTPTLSHNSGTPTNQHRSKSKPSPQANHNHNLSQQNRRNSTEPMMRETPKTQPYQWISSAAMESDARDSGSGRYDSTPSIIEKYFQSQEPYAQQQQQKQPNTSQQVFPNPSPLGNRNGLDHMNNRDSMLTEEESVDLHELDSQLDPPPPQQPNNNKRSPPRYTELFNREPHDNDVTNDDDNDDDDGPNTQNKPSLPNYRDIISSLSDYSDAPRALFRKDSNGADQPVSSRRAKRNRKSLDSLLLKTLEDIEEQAVLNSSNPTTTSNNNNSNNGSVNTHALEKHVAIVRDALQKATRSFDSVSSTCSSSVGELRRAFEFGKKYGLQQYGEIPDYLQESMDDLTVAGDNDDDDEGVNAFQDFLDQEKLLDLMSLTNFSEQPKSLNDIEVKMPLPVRLNDSSSDEEDDDDAGSGDDFIPDTFDNHPSRTASTSRGNHNKNQHQTLSLV